MERKIKVGAVSYLNTKPLIYGFEKGALEEEIELVLDHPANIASLLVSGQIDIGLVPVAIIPELKEYHIISNYCIGCDGEVGSVCLFSDVPVDKIEKVLLDYQSRTSADLLKILLKEHWKSGAVIETTGGDYQDKIKGTTAALVIGDRALAQRSVSAFHYDLGREWKNFTGLPFVFAAWISNMQLPAAFIRAFDQANSLGLSRLNEVIAGNASPYFDLGAYYTKYIRYIFDEKASKGLKAFLAKLPVS